MRLFLYSIILAIVFTAKGQGIYTDFGQNRVQNNTTNYSLKQDNIEIIYSEDGIELAQLVLGYINNYLPEFENKLNYNLSNGIKVVVFNNFIAYQNSNITLTNPQHYAGGYSTLSDNTSAVYFTGNRIDLQLQTRKAVAEVMINEFIFGGDLRDRIQTSALLTLPDWYYKGLVSYLAESWNIDNDNYLKDFLLTGKAKTFNSLQQDDEILAGHSIWRYLEEKYGKSSVSNVVFLTRVGRSIESAFNYYTGLTINNMFKDWQEFYKEKYKEDEAIFKLPRGEENSLAKLSKQRHTQFKLSIDGKKLALVTNVKGKYQIVLYAIKSRTYKIILKGGHQSFNRLADYNYPIIAWHPDGKKLMVITIKNNKTLMTEFDLTGLKIKSYTIENVPFIKEMSFNKDGNEILFTVIRNSQSDIIRYNLNEKTFTDLINDGYDDKNPRYALDGKSIYFSSNRTQNNTFENYFSIFSIDLDSKIVTEIISNPKSFVNYTHPVELNNGYISFLSDRNGIINNYAITKDDKILQLTNYKRCIIDNDVANNQNTIADLIFYNNAYRIYIGDISENLEEDAIDLSRKTAYKKWLILNNNLKDSVVITSTNQDSISNIKSAPIDTVKKVKIFISGFSERDELANEMSTIAAIQKNLFTSQYRLNFGMNYFLQQFDNSILNSYLYPANVSEVVYNYPLLNTLFQNSISDNLKNYTIEAGFRIPINIKLSDYFIKYTNRKGRWDKTFSGFRKGRTFESERIATKMVTGEAKLCYSYPFNERNRIEVYGRVREDKIITLATDSISLLKTQQGNLYGSTGIEYVYDNIISRGLNLFEGIRFKLYSENYIGLRKNTQILNSGFDGRYYQKLHRQIYFAARLSGAISLGKQFTGYYLGGVENQFGVGQNSFARSTENFNYSISTLTGDGFAFQTIVAPMRGFLRNSRGGNKYAVLNAELRIPLLSYLIKKPITSAFFKSLMVVGFADIGTAWQFATPYSTGNPFNTKLLTTPSYNITVVSQRDPFLYGFGLGLRAKVLGHYLKLDNGWGLIENKFQKNITTFSMGLDF